MEKNLYTTQRKEILSQGTTQFPLAFYQGDLVENAVPTHWHDEFETGYVLEGALTLFVGAEKHVLREGEGYFINSGVLHAFTKADGAVSRQRSLVFNASLVGGRADSVFWHRYCRPLIGDGELPYLLLDRTNSWQADCIDTLVRTWRCCRDGYEEYELNARHYLSHLLHIVCTHLPVKQVRISEKEQRDRGRIKTMLSYIHEHYADELNVQSIASSAMISHSECLRCFHDTIGTTPVRYVREYRVQKASELLTGTSRSISEIASSCGFGDTSYFTRIFREIKNCSPGEFRRN